ARRGGHPKRRASHGQEREADGEKTSHEVPQPAKEVAEGQNPVKTGREKVTTRSSRRASICHHQRFSFANRSISLNATVRRQVYFSLRFNSASCSFMNCRIWSAKSSSLSHCST